MRAELWLIALLGFLVSGTAAAYADAAGARGVDSAPVNAACSAAARDCCRLITVACIELKYRPRCDWPAHQCATPLTPGPPAICRPRVCHKPLATCYLPAPCLCLAPGCHKPAVATQYCETCVAAIELTGSPELIAENCAE